MGIRPADQGRKICELNLGLRIESLESKLREVLDTLNTYAADVQSVQDGWYSLRIQPYRTSDDRITGAVLVLIDITESRHYKESLRNAQALSEGIVAAVPDPLVILDAQLRVVTANRAFYHMFQVASSDTEGRLLYELGDGQWDNPELRRLLEEIIPENALIEGFELVHGFPQIGRKRIILDGRRIEQEGDRPHLILMTVRHIGDP